MTDNDDHIADRPKRSLRRRMLASLLSLGLLPLAAATAGLFFVANEYVAEIQRLQPQSHLHEQFVTICIQAAFLLILFVGMIIALAWRTADQFLRPILKIRRGAEIVARINLDHRIELDSGDELEDLAREFNHMAGNLGKVYEEQEGRIREATRTVQEERNLLATVLRTMVDGVVVANEEAETILMNPRARIILNLEFTSGIGTPLSRILPGERLNFHLERVRRKWDQGRDPVEEVLFPLGDGKLLKGSLSVVPGSGVNRCGFLFVFRDLTDSGYKTGNPEDTLRETPQMLRGPLATSSSLIEALQRHRNISDEKQQTFLSAVAEEIKRINERIKAIEEAGSSARSARWPAVPSDPRQLLREALLPFPETETDFGGDSVAFPAVLVEPFSWVTALGCVMNWIKQNSQQQMKISAGLQVEENAVVTTFRVCGPFNGNPAELEQLQIRPAGEPGLPLGETVRKNRGEMWTRVSEECLEVRLALMQSGNVCEDEHVEGLRDGEPEFYDFDLFLPRPVVERADQLQSTLEDLEYVVFDTETTGMRLSEGDKVISISGVRIRRGRIQNAETFHSLVNPGRPIPAESIRFHHIEDHMVADAPCISQVYPQFVEFVGDSVLVAHNAAFDRKCLEMAAAEAGLPLIENPFLDTLFLSYGLHEGTEGHGLDAMAERMGITIEGRHTSLGDARATARIFLGLISLLPGRGVRTLAEAKAFCDRHLLLRWQSSRF